MAKQSLKQALRLTRIPGTDMARAAHALDGCPVGGWGETDQAYRRIREYLPRRSERDYSLDEFVDAAYTIDHADRYRPRDQA